MIFPEASNGREKLELRRGQELVKSTRCVRAVARSVPRDASTNDELVGRSGTVAPSRQRVTVIHAR